MRLTLALLGLLLGLSVCASPTTLTLNINNTVSFNQPFKGDYVSKKIFEIMDKNFKLPYGAPIYLVLDSPGGSVIDGNLLIDTIKALGRPVHTVTIFAASMGYQTVQNLGKRYILPSGVLMSHRGSLGGLSGQIPGELNTRLGFYMDMMNDLDLRAAKRIGTSLSKYQQLIWNELWVSGQKAVDGKHADEIALVRCDKSMSGSHSEVVATMFGEVELVYSDCPLVTNPIGMKYANGVSRDVQQKAVKEFINSRRKVITNL